jgi:hypothetical protein
MNHSRIIWLHIFVSAVSINLCAVWNIDTNKQADKNCLILKVRLETERFVGWETFMQMDQAAWICHSSFVLETVRHADSRSWSNGQMLCKRVSSVVTCKVCWVMGKSRFDFFLTIRTKAHVLRASSLWCHSEGVPPLETTFLEVLCTQIHCYTIFVLTSLLTFTGI